jgi:hypothetical protein
MISDLRRDGTRSNYDMAGLWSGSWRVGLKRWWLSSHIRLHIEHRKPFYKFIVYECTSIETSQGVSFRNLIELLRFVFSSWQHRP